MVDQNPFAAKAKADVPKGERGGTRVEKGRDDLCPMLGRVLIPVEKVLIESARPQVELEVTHGPCLRNQCTFFCGESDDPAKFDPNNDCVFISACNAQIDTANYMEEIVKSLKIQATPPPQEADPKTEGKEG